MIYYHHRHSCADSTEVLSIQYPCVCADISNSANSTHFPGICVCSSATGKKPAETASPSASVPNTVADYSKVGDNYQDVTVLCCREHPVSMTPPRY